MENSFCKYGLVWSIKPLKVSQKTGFLNKEDIGMVNNYIKRCTTSLVSTETNNNNNTYHYTPTRMTKTKKAEYAMCQQRWRATETLIHCWWKLYSHLGKLFGIKLTGVYPREMKTCVNKRTCPWMFTLFIMAPNWIQPKCSLTGE